MPNRSIFGVHVPPRIADEIRIEKRFKDPITGKNMATIRIKKSGYVVTDTIESIQRTLNMRVNTLKGHYAFDINNPDMNARYWENLNKSEEYEALTKIFEQRSPENRRKRALSWGNSIMTGIYKQLDINDNEKGQLAQVLDIMDTWNAEDWENFYEDIKYNTDILEAIRNYSLELEDADNVNEYTTGYHLVNLVWVFNMDKYREHPEANPFPSSLRDRMYVGEKTGNSKWVERPANDRKINYEPFPNRGKK